MKLRIYVVRDKNRGCTQKKWLVRAPSRNAALHYIAQRDLTAELAEQDTLVQMLKGGHQVEEAREQQSDLLEPPVADESAA